KQAYINCRDTFIDSARRNIENFKKAGSVSPVVDMLSKSEIQFVSSLIYGAMRRKERNEPYSEDERHIIDKLKRFSGFNDNISTLRGLANIDDVREKTFKTVKAKKDAILDERRSTLIDSQYGKFIALLEEINVRGQTNYKTAKETDVDKLQHMLDVIEHRMNNCRDTVKSIFVRASSEVLEARNQMLIEVMKDVENFKDISVKESTRDEKHSKTSGHLFWKKTEYYTTYITDKVANISDVQNNVNAYRTKALDIVNKRFEYMLDIDTLKNNVKKAVLDMMDTGAKDFDENSVILPLESVLRKITIPRLEFGVEKYYKMLDEELSGIACGGTVKNDNIPLLLLAQNKVFTNMEEDIKLYISKQCDDVSSFLSAQSGTFIDAVLQKFKGDVQSIKDSLKEGREGLKKYENFLATLKEAKAVINKRGK
ncbi:MAG: hypothetical protein NC401_19965, partial [Ruminococcus sp.]|nr:hypothetical protein [Ruminococcus sp.]